MCIQEPAICGIGLQQDSRPQRGDFRDRTAMGAQGAIQSAAQRQRLAIAGHCEELLHQGCSVVGPTVSVVGNEQDRAPVCGQQSAQRPGSRPEIDVCHPGKTINGPETAANDPDAGLGAAGGQRRQGRTHAAAPRSGHQQRSTDTGQIDQ
jgi:hypothetical protein